MNFTDGVWAVEYARGPLSLSMPFGLADEIFSCLDYGTALQTVSMYTSLIGRHWANPQNYDYRLLVPIKKTAALLMNLIGPALTKALTPPPPIELNEPKGRKAAPAAARKAATRVAVQKVAPVTARQAAQKRNGGRAAAARKRALR